MDDNIREFVAKSVDELPDYFFRIAASSTGKYHPSYALGDGGLVRHTKAAVSIAHELLGLEMYGKFTQEEKDIILAALILHDGRKHGINGSSFTVAEHPTIMAEWVKSPGAPNMLSEEQTEILYGAIASHMGQWNTDYKTKKEILPKPKTALQKFVHQSDYLASRKYLEFNFGDSYYKPVEEKADVTIPERNELDAVKESIVNLCKAKIAGGAESKVLYALMADKTGGNKNPNSITSVDIAKGVLKELEELNIA